MNESLASILHAANTKLIAEGDLSVIPNFFSEAYFAHLTGKEMKGGHEMVRQIVSKLRQTFPDVRVEIEILVEAEDRIAWQRTLSGTQKGAFKGFPATNREIVWRDVITSRFEAGKIAEDWFITDLAEQLLLARKR